MIIGYARVSTKDQNLSLQIDALKNNGCEKIFEDKKSGKNLERTAFNQMMSMIREGDTVVVYSWSRLSRSVKDLRATIKHFEDNKINFISICEKTDTTTAQGKLYFDIMGSLSEFERNLLIERTNAGLEAARLRGRFGGRKPKNIDPKKIELAFELYDGRKTSVTQIAKFLGVCVPVFYKLIRQSGKYKLNKFESPKGWVKIKEV